MAPAATNSQLASCRTGRQPGGMQVEQRAWKVPAVPPPLPAAAKPPNRSPPIPMDRNMLSICANGSPPKKLSKKEGPRPPGGGRWRPLIGACAGGKSGGVSGGSWPHPGEALERVPRPGCPLEAIHRRPGRGAATAATRRRSGSHLPQKRTC